MTTQTAGRSDPEPDPDGDGDGDSAHRDGRPAPGGTGVRSQLVIAGPPIKLTATTVLLHPRPLTRTPAPEPPQPADAAPARTESSGTGGWLLPLLVVIIGMFMSILDTSIVNIAIPSIQNDFGATSEAVQWISTSYTLTEGAIVTVSAWLGNRIGHKKLYVVSIALFTVVSALCGLSQSLGEMITFRFLQAIPGGMIPVTCITLIYRMVPREKIGTAMGLYGLGVIVAPAVGPTLGGYFVEYATWHYIYWVNVPIGIVGSIAAAAVVPNAPGSRDKPFDLPGFACIATALVAALLAFEEGTSWGWTGYRVLGLLALASNLLILFVIIERQVEHPLLNLRVFGNSRFVRSLAVIGALMAGLSATLYYLPQFLQNVQGYTPWHTGLIVLPQALVLMVLMPLAGKLYELIGSRWPAVLGTLTAGGGLLWLARLNTDITLREVIIGECLFALGIGMSLIPVMTGGLAALPGELGDSGSTFNTLTQRVSQSFGLALLTAMVTIEKAQVFTARSGLTDPRDADADASIRQLAERGTNGLLGLWQQYSNKALTQAYSNAFLVVGTVLVLSAVIAFTLPGGKPVATEGAPPAAH